MGSYKVQIAAAIVAFQIRRHERPTQEPSCNTDTWGTRHSKIVVSCLSSIRSTSVILLACLQPPSPSGPPAVDHYGLDALGNVRWLYSNNGAEDIIDYYPFGGERLSYSTSAGNNTRLFTSKERDSESGKDNFAACYYSSNLGRFTSPDDTAADDHEENPQGLNPIHLRPEQSNKRR